MVEEETTELIDTIEEIKQEKKDNKKKKVNYFKYFIGSLIKPYDTYKEYENELSDIKSVGIISSVLIILFMILRLIKSIIGEVRVRNYWNNEVNVNFNNISNVNFIKVIGLGLIFFIILLAILSGVYYLASLVIKKNVKYEKLLLIACISIIPFSLGYLILNPLFSVIHNAIGLSLLIVSISYSLIILIMLTNNLINIEDNDKKIYFHVICISIIIIMSLFLIYEIDLKSLIDDIKLISNFLK